MNGNQRFFTLGLMTCLLILWSTSAWSFGERVDPEINQEADDAGAYMRLDAQDKALAKPEIPVGKSIEPFHNPYWNNKQPGIYVDAITNEPLFSSLEQFTASTGWPSFVNPISAECLTFRTISDNIYIRTEILGAQSNAHLGYVYNDLKTRSGKRYMIDANALKFIAVADMDRLGYSDYLNRFQDYYQAPRQTIEQAATQPAQTEQAVLAAGSFWNAQYWLSDIPGVLNTRTGYIGGSVENPTYAQVVSGKTGHAEAVWVLFDPGKLTFSKLLTYFFKIHDPTQLNHQGTDVGTMYRSSIFYTSDSQKKAAEQVVNRLIDSHAFPNPIVTQIVPATVFYIADDSQQNYVSKHPEHPLPEMPAGAH